MAEQPTHSVTAIDQILGPGTQVELIFDVNLIKDFIDVRTATVLEMVDDYIIITQASPPVLKSMVGSSPEATFVRRDSVTGEILRWGWRTQIEEIVENYRPKPIDDLPHDDLPHDSQPHDEQPMTALIISCPSVGGLTATNARIDYRLNTSDDRKISIQTHPSFGRVSLLDFSAGGALIAIPRPPQATVGMKLWFTIFFPGLTSDGQPTIVTGEAKVMRVTIEEDEPTARAGLKFLDLDLAASRALQKAINYYMLEEQRSRGRASREGQIPGGGQTP